MKEQILSEIKRIVHENGGEVPGHRAFCNETGVRESDWRGVYWARWGDALVEAGFSPNEKTGKRDEQDLFEQLAICCRHYRKFPTRSEMQLYRRSNPDFPGQRTFVRRFGSKDGLVSAFTLWISSNPANEDLREFIPKLSKGTQGSSNTDEFDGQKDGFVYLLRSGRFHKIGRSNDVERRIREIRVTLPESVDMEHVIKTDDPAGIEAYWHKRFANKRANGEWFELTPADVKSFKRRLFQ